MEGEIKLKENDLAQQFSESKYQELCFSCMKSIIKSKNISYIDRKEISMRVGKNGEYIS